MPACSPWLNTFSCLLNLTGKRFELGILTGYSTGCEASEIIVEV
jgi:hypothetical protein